VSLSRYANRRDANEKEIVAALEKIGCTVYQLDTPVDILVGYRAKNYLIEIKTKKGKTTEAQREFFASWKGQVRIVRTVDEAIKLVTESYGRSR
jgi:hypothetical protein